MKDAEVFETESGLVVVTKNTERLRAALRKQRREKDRLKARKAVKRRAGGSTGRAVWMAASKRQSKAQRTGDMGSSFFHPACFATMKCLRPSNCPPCSYYVKGERGTQAA